jgi:5-methylcytosine-specific restriction endonuclease McrA
MTLPPLNEFERRKLAAWTKAQAIPGYDASKYRKDRFDTWIAFDQYGKTTMYGWEIDHIKPLSLGGILAQHNELATHWHHNRAKSNRFIG